MTGATKRVGNLVLRDHRVTVPLDHAHPSGDTLKVYAREVVAVDKDSNPDLPWLLWLQGGPGVASPRPEGDGGWLGRALTEFRVVLMDQRGTGRSTPVNQQTIPHQRDAQAQAEYLTHFRADAIVADAEVLRQQVTGGRRWSILGQSFGGFCAVTYLSKAPEGLREVLVAGGLPALSGGPDPIYQATYKLVVEHTQQFFARYPETSEQVTRVLDHLTSTTETLPTGEPLTPQRFQTIGINLGTKARARTLHYLLEEPFVTTGSGSRLSETFLHDVGQSVSMATRPLYAVLHESIYCQGQASRWSANRVRAEQHPDPVLTGEMLYPWQFDQDPSLVGLTDAAQLLAAKDDWPALYDQRQLSRNTVPAAAVIYLDDMFVPAEYSRQTAASIASLRCWKTNEFAHDGIRTDGSAVLDRLLRMARDEI